MTTPTVSRPDIPAEELHQNGRRVRKGALPEHATYKDEGCELAPSCLRCPFARCQHDKEKKR